MGEWSACLTGVLSKSLVIGGVYGLPTCVAVGIDAVLLPDWLTCIVMGPVLFGMMGPLLLYTVMGALLVMDIGGVGDVSDAFLCVEFNTPDMGRSYLCSVTFGDGDSL